MFYNFFFFFLFFFLFCPFSSSLLASSYTPLPCVFKSACYSSFLAFPAFPFLALAFDQYLEYHFELMAPVGLLLGFTCELILTFAIIIFRHVNSHQHSQK